MISTIVRVQIGQDGTLKLLKRAPRKTNSAERALFDRAAELLRASYQDADLDAVWQDIKAGRRDREL